MYLNLEDGSPEQYDGDDVIRRAVTQLREPLPIDSTFDARVMAAVRAEENAMRTAGVGRRRVIWGWSMSLAFASVATLVLLSVRSHIGAAHTSAPNRPVYASPVAVANAGTITAAHASRTPQKVRFEFVTLELRGVHRVTIVGSFNGWNTAATPLRPVGRGRWATDIPLLPGRYTYQFVINGRKWVPDPGAPRDAGSDFGISNSVVTIADGGVT
jgi:hypothetical protein